MPTIRTELDGDVFTWSLVTYPALEACEACGLVISDGWNVAEKPRPEWYAGSQVYCGTCAGNMISDCSTMEVAFHLEGDMKGYVCEGVAIFELDCCEDNPTGPTWMIAPGLDVTKRLPIMDLDVCDEALRLLWKL